MPEVASPLSPTRAVARRVRELRRSKKWTAETLAQKMTEAGIGWNRGVVTKLENGWRESVSITELLALASVFDTSINALLGEVTMPVNASSLPREIVVDRQEPHGWPRVTVDGYTLPWFVSAVTVGDISLQTLATVTLTLEAELVVQANSTPVSADEEDARVREAQLIDRLRRELHETLDTLTKTQTALAKSKAANMVLRDELGRP